MCPDVEWIPVSEIENLPDEPFFWITVEEPDGERKVMLATSDFQWIGTENGAFYDPNDADQNAIGGVTHYAVIVYPDPPEEA